MELPEAKEKGFEPLGTVEEGGASVAAASEEAGAGAGAVEEGAADDKEKGAGAGADFGGAGTVEAKEKVGLGVSGTVAGEGAEGVGTGDGKVVEACVEGVGAVSLAGPAAWSPAGPGLDGGFPKLKVVEAKEVGAAAELEGTGGVIAWEEVKVAAGAGTFESGGFKVGWEGVCWAGGLVPEAPPPPNEKELVGREGAGVVPVLPKSEALPGREVVAEGALPKREELAGGGAGVDARGAAADGGAWSDAWVVPVDAPKAGRAPVAWRVPNMEPEPNPDVLDAGVEKVVLGAGAGAAWFPN